MEIDETVRDETVVTQDPLSAALAPLGRVVAIGFLIVTFFTFYEVTMRYVFNAPTSWVHETTIAMTAICFAFGGAYCLAIDKHIRVVLIYDAISPAARRWLDVAICVVGGLACALMAWAAWSLAYRAFYTPSGTFRLETSGSAWNPPTPAIVKAVLFLMLCIMTVQFALQAIAHLRRDPHDSPPEGAAEKRAFEDA
ncbi:TRAP transporter small permease subunit [Palleronia sp.]|uniref:TRAP transporter small permease subunit n=1 Tax=Palleronia sp. TaxID=1940284 RepID=UPI0035C7A864